MRIHLKKLDSSNTKNLTQEGIRVCNEAQLEIVLLDTPLTIEDLKQAVEAPGLTFIATSEETQALKDWEQFKQELLDFGIYDQVSFLTFDAIEVPDCYSTGKLVLPENMELKMTRFDLIKKLEEIREQIVLDSDKTITDYAREQAYICVEQAIEFLKENEE